MSSENRGLVKLVHATARGRVRLAVSGLYRSQRLKQALEDALAGVGSIRAVQAALLSDWPIRDVDYVQNVVWRRQSRRRSRIVFNDLYDVGMGGDDFLAAGSGAQAKVVGQAEAGRLSVSGHVPAALGCTIGMSMQQTRY